MNHVGTHPDILDTERNGRPDGEPEIVSCPTCERMTYKQNIVPCTKCGQETCMRCDVILVLKYGWRFCSQECAIAYLVDQIDELNQENWRLKHANND